jgi:hypothetical protein
MIGDASLTLLPLVLVLEAALEREHSMDVSPTPFNSDVNEGSDN